MTQANQSVPAPLPTDPIAFYSAGAGMDALRPAPPEVPSALERLGPSPFPKAKFPFLGFLASVYDHVSTHAKARTAADAGDGAGRP